MKKRFLRTVAIALSILIIASLFTAVPTVGAVEIDEAAVAGSSWSSATSYKFGNQVSGSITNSNTENYYKFTLSSSGEINLIANSYMYSITYKIYDANYKEVKYWKQYWNDTTKVASTNETIDLVSGTYYFVVARYNSNNGNYNFKLNFTSANETFAESQTNLLNDYSKAKSISLNSTYKGQIAENDTVDYYKFTLPSSGKINLIANSYMYSITYKIYDANYKEVKYWNRYWNDTTKVGTLNETVDLSAGTYYFVVAKNSTGNYNFKLNSLNFTVPQIIVDSKTATAGGQVVVNVTMKNNPGINGWALDMSYDSSALELVKCESGVYNDITTSNVITKNPYRIQWYSLNDVKTNGSLFKLTFNVKQNAKKGVYPINLTYKEDEICNQNEEKVHFDVVEGSVTVSTHVPGDINNDGKVNLRDVIRLNQYVAGWNVTVNSGSTDVNGDGKTNLRDVIRLNQYVAGWNVSIK